MNEVVKFGLVLLGNHLWQSTLFAIAMGGLALLLRRNSARLRYWLWLAASLKFLVPFALLAALGTQIPWHPTAAVPEAATPVILDLAGNFTAPMAFEIQFPQLPATGAPSTEAPRAAEGTFPLILILVAWALGATFVTLRWFLRWLEVRRAVRNSTVVTGVDFPAPVRSTTTQLEPGIVGIFRPSLLLPAGIEDRLTPAQMRAVLAHERCHLRCRDNLAASLHMRVEILFWYFPLVWWIGARLIEERERACDEEVLRDGHAAESYAEGILAVCEHYIASRLPSVSGVSGADLRMRIERIARKTLAVKMDAPKKVVLAAVIGCTVAAPLAAGMVTGGTWQVLFSLQPQSAAMVEYFQFTSAAVMSSSQAQFRRGPLASTCPAPNSATASKRQKALAATVARLSAGDGDRALLYAVAANSTADVKRLLASGAARSGDGFLYSNSLIHVAAQFSDTRMLQVLADAGFDMKGWSGPFGRQGNGLSADTPLMLAISAGRRDNVEWLIRNGADVSAANEAGTSALVLAMTVCRDQTLVSRLIQAGAQPNAKARRIATSQGFYLTAAGTAASVEGRSALYGRATAMWDNVMGSYATAGVCRFRNTHVRQGQQRLAAALSGLSARDGEDMLLYAVTAGSTADVKRLLAEGASTSGFREYPLLHTAAQFGDPPMLELLVQAGLEVNALNNRGASALQAAAADGREENMAWLIRHGAAVNALNYRSLHAAFCKDQTATSGIVLPTDNFRVPRGELLRGWRAPTRAELEKVPYRSKSPTKYVQATADMDGDGKPDQAAILIATDESMEALFVKLSSRNPHDWTFAAQRTHRPGAGFTSGIAVHEPGRVVSACEKGYGHCDATEPQLVLQHQGIDYFEFESAASVVYYDKTNLKFKQVFYSD